MLVYNSIAEKLRNHFQPEYFDLENQSHLHAGHGGLPKPGELGHGESHFRLTMVAKAFSGKNRLDRQRLVYQLLANDLAGPIHALNLNLRSPEEYKTNPGVINL